MRHFPVFLDLTGRCVLVLGEGPVAARKAALLTEAGAVLRRAVHFTPDLLEGCAFALGADAPEADLRALSAAAMARGMAVNIVDRPDLCSAILPAIVDRTPLTIAIGTGGAAPVLARLVRAKIEAAIPPGYATLARLAAQFRDRLRARFADAARRRRVLEETLGGQVGALAIAGRVAEAEAAMAAAIDGAAMAAPGMVHLVGAGPGAADLLTLRAQRLLGEADVIVHDRLVGAGVLDLARRDAERIDVGKARAHHCVPQPEINALLIRLARAGKRVVRLKGGDPFVFGRGGEEAAALRAAGIAVEVVPGITAALGCAAEAGIPLTHRDLAHHLILATGHAKDGSVGIDFAAAARPGVTLAVYMGLATLPQLRAGLAAYGGDPATPAALVENGGTGAARVLRGTLDTLIAEAGAWTQGGPVLVIHGQVAAEDVLRAAPPVVERAA
ncbi:MAG: uroporphyrinogen-III C-methyltransferase [Rhodospirillales bacterium]|nr:uroporphyrinogen-III C-methyltransferase [Rhodospirillales bacterium]